MNRDRDTSERGRHVRVRRYRVERSGLPACTVCGGATNDPVDTTLACDCEHHMNDLRSRLEQRARSNQAQAMVTDDDGDQA